MPARARWIAALAAAILAAAAVALALAPPPSEEERLEARARACLLLVLSVFGGPDLTADSLGETDAFDGDDDEPWPTLADVDAAGPAFTEPLRDIAAFGAEFSRDEEPSDEEADRYWEAVGALATACDEAGLLDSDGAADREQPDDPAVRDMLERMESEPGGAPSESD